MRGRLSTILMTTAVAAISITTSIAFADGDGRYVGGRFDEFYNGQGLYDYGQRKHDGGVQLGQGEFALLRIIGETNGLT